MVVAGKADTPDSDPACGLWVNPKLGSMRKGLVPDGLNESPVRSAG
jgi:hypothetical protein